ncbi:MAG TPA: hypothetical protein VH120_09250, partial [Gemmataceae bacterium]|nr:hypothetical protein [Gemmataceae bacterium]
MANDRRRQARPGKPHGPGHRPGKPYGNNNYHRPGKPYGPRPHKPPPKPQPHAGGFDAPAGTGIPGPPALGVLELHPKGFGFLRNPKFMYAAQPADPYVAGPLIQKLGLREGLLLSGPLEGARKGTGPRL